MGPRPGSYECVLCGAAVDIPVSGKPRVVVLEARNDGTRILSFDGRELHRCAIGVTDRALHRPSRNA